MIELNRFWSHGSYPGGAFWLALLVLVFAAVVDISWSVGSGLPAESVIQLEQQGEMPDLPNSVPKGAEVSVALKRPAFHANRKLFQPPTMAALTVVAPAPTFKLAGVVEGADRSWAYLEMISSNETYRVRIGDEIDGWTVELIKKDLVRLRRGSSEAILGAESTTNGTTRSR